MTRGQDPPETKSELHLQHHARRHGHQSHADHRRDLQTQDREFLQRAQPPVHALPEQHMLQQLQPTEEKESVRQLFAASLNHALRRK